MFATVYSLSLALFFVAAGATKLVRSKQSLVTSNGGAWAADFSPSAIKGIGALEGCAAFALASASLTDQPRIAMIACSMLVAVVIGAVVTHVKRREYGQSAFAAVVAIALAIAIVLTYAHGGS